MTARAELEELIDRHMTAMTDDERALACGVLGVARVQDYVARVDDVPSDEAIRELEAAVALIDAGSSLLGNGSASPAAAVYESFVLSFRMLAANLLDRLRN